MKIINKLNCPSNYNCRVCKNFNSREIIDMNLETCEKEHTRTMLINIYRNYSITLTLIPCEDYESN